MATKKPTKDVAQSKARPPNKQRVTLLSPIERRARTLSGGAIDERLPATAVRILAKQSEATKRAIGREIGLFKFEDKFNNAALSPTESRKQLLATAALLSATHERLTSLDSNVAAYVSDDWWDAPWSNKPGKTFKEFANEHMGTWLIRTAVLLQGVADRIPAGRAGRPALRNRDRLSRIVSTALVEDGMSEPRAIETTIEILKACGIPMPGEARKLKGRPKSRAKSTD